jgi:endonuclease VIII
VPEGDTLARIAAVLRPLFVGKAIRAARARPGMADLRRVCGSAVTSVETRGKHLLIDFDAGLTLHTHLGMTGSWHRYRVGERWRRPASRAVAVLETDDFVAVCFDAPTVELIETRALAIHPVLRGLGPDVARHEFDIDTALARLREPGRAGMAIGDALLDQRALAGLGNVYRSELPFLARLNPLTPTANVSDEQVREMLERGSLLVKQNSAGGARVTTTAGTPGNAYVYGRAGRPCRRCGALIQSTTTARGPALCPGASTGAQAASAVTNRAKLRSRAPLPANIIWRVPVTRRPDVEEGFETNDRSFLARALGARPCSWQHAGKRRGDPSQCCCSDALG